SSRALGAAPWPRVRRTESVSTARRPRERHLAPALDRYLGAAVRTCGVTLPVRGPDRGPTLADDRVRRGVGPQSAVTGGQRSDPAWTRGGSATDPISALGLVGLGGRRAIDGRVL